MKGKIHSSKAESIYSFYLLWGGQGIPRGIQSEWAVVECVSGGFAAIVAAGGEGGCLVAVVAVVVPLSRWSCRYRGRLWCCGSYGLGGKWYRQGPTWPRERRRRQSRRLAFCYFVSACATPT